MGVAAQVVCAIQLQNGTVYFVTAQSLRRRPRSIGVNEWERALPINLPRGRRTLQLGDSGREETISTSNFRDDLHSLGRAQLPLGEGNSKRNADSFVTFEPPVTRSNGRMIGLRPVENRGPVFIY